MSLVPAKCPECGGNVVVDSEKEAWICDFCKTPFIVEKAINTFNTVNNITNNNEIKADVVNVYESKNSEFVIKAGKLIEYNGESMDVTIPEQVVAIAGNVFRGSSIRSIIIHEGVSEVGSFDGCNRLEKVKLPNGLKGELPSFKGCVSLKSINIPREISRIPSEAFMGCSSLKEVVIPESVKKIGGAVFVNCYSLEHIELPKTLEVLDNHYSYGTFENCKSLKYVQLPDSVNIIGNKMFFNCSTLETVRAEQVRSISEGAFKNCTNLKNIPDFPKLISVGRYSSDGDAVGAFEGCTSFRNIELNGKIKWGAETFRNCENLTNIKIQGNMEIIPDYFFMGCKKIKAINLENVERISANSFSEETIVNIGLETDFLPVEKNLAGNIYSGYWENKKNIKKRIEQEKKIVEDIVVMKVKERIESGSQERKQCPFCKKYTINRWTGRCSNDACISYGIKATEVEARILNAIKTERCPSCNSRLKVELVKYGNTPSFSIECTNKSLKCNFFHWIFGLRL